MEGSWLWEKCKHETDAISGRGNTVIFYFNLCRKFKFLYVLILFRLDIYFSKFFF